MTNLGPVPLVPWGTTWNKDKNTTRRLLSVPCMVLGVGVSSKDRLSLITPCPRDIDLGDFSWTQLSSCQPNHFKYSKHSEPKMSLLNAPYIDPELNFCKKYPFTELHLNSISSDKIHSFLFWKFSL